MVQGPEAIGIREQGLEGFYCSSNNDPTPPPPPPTPGPPPPHKLVYCVASVATVEPLRLSGLWLGFRALSSAGFLVECHSKRAPTATPQNPSHQAEIPRCLHPKPYATKP